MSFVTQIETENAERLAAIHAMPFNAELTDGRLPPETFRFYIVQDAHYLEGFARALALAASRAPDPETIARLAGSANGAIMVERQLHDEYMTLYGVTREAFLKTPPSPACDHYVSSLVRAAAIDPFPVAVAALLPCFSIYLAVGEAIHAKAVSDHPYRAWVDTYAGEEFAFAVRGMRDLTDRLAQEADARLRARMQAAFERSVWHEWMFWHSAYHRDAWPMPDSAGLQM
ncbi:TenA family protein [Fulvimarina sp. 2208YS6-2-32]|uniref:TenA family protein n=1 Tax=Fulvimarina uroteuthidis TaxID=3098149 RepID=A0ABU5I380_9HYPH|nr:TenA family protein [Fulvimarina sp. 2208YS6-2-32]MDY8108636.1 TenA family protein [Fulvimarina sp. 2208YS6-2-32]